ncbi:MAG: ferredoxin [Candidatus Aenigmarchaeota archaeon]|nr:ferredoxin [Candidatus Aenigmarchaeota archaeon]
MAKRYKVVFDRDLCIGAAACATAHPSGWEIDKEDGKANLVGGIKTGVEKFEMVFDESQYRDFLNASEVCPVAGCIVIVEIEE